MPCLIACSLFRRFVSLESGSLETLQLSEQGTQFIGRQADSPAYAPLALMLCGFKIQPPR